MSDDIAFMSIVDLVEAFRKRKVSPVEAAKAALTRIDKYNAKLNVYCHIDRAGALNTAREAEARWAKGEPKGLIDGVPMPVKDSLQVAGMPMRSGSKTSSDGAMTEDTSHVAAARRHGAVFLGKATTPEYGLGAVTISPLTGVSRNPWNSSQTCGGSSGGPAAACAAGMGNAALGTDAGGSIRIPAAFNGLVAMKTSNGRVPVHPPAWVPLLFSIGALTRTVTDQAVMLNVITEPDPRDPNSLPYDGANYKNELNDGVRGLKIAFSRTLGFAPYVDPELAEIVAGAVKVFEDLGARVEEKDPGFANPGGAFRNILFPHFTRFANRFKPEEFEKLGDAAKATFENGKKVSIDDHLAAMETRAAMIRHMHAFHQTYDLLVTPMTAVPPFAADRWGPPELEKTGDIRAWAPFGNPFNLTGQPAISIPCGFTKGGLPIGLQIVGPRFGDKRVLRAARAFETVRSFVDRRPTL
ncbi:MAG: amidase [Alphaproteobacteria bacterium]|nr:amidase [Alphaproteobacteria bacterium]